MSRSSEITNAGPVGRLALAAAAPTVFQQSAAFAKLNAPSLAAVLSPPGTNRLEKKLVTIRASGVFYNAGAAGTATLGLYTGTDTNVANDTLLATIGGAAAATGFTPFIMETRIMIDSSSGTIIGDTSGIVGAAIVARTALSSTPTGISSANEPVITAVFAITPPNATAGSYAILDTFALEE